MTRTEVERRLARIVGPRRRWHRPTVGCQCCWWSLWLVVVWAVSWCEQGLGAEPLPDLAQREIGYTVMQTNLPGGRHANARTARAVVSRGDGTARRLVAEQLLDDPEAWTQFAGWSPDGRYAVVHRGWQDAENAQWEEEHREFRFLPGRRRLDGYLLDMATGQLTDVTGVDRVSDYNSVAFQPDGERLLMTSLIDGVSRPYVMDSAGRHKRPLGQGDQGFTYGLGASPDGTRVSYHENYQVVIAAADGSQAQQIATGNPFNFAPTWSPDGKWLLFVSGERGNSHPYIVRSDGTGLRKLADLNGYQGWILHLDVPDFHEGSSDLPVWSAAGDSVIYAARDGRRVDLFQVTLEGEVRRLTNSPDDTLHYHPTPSRDGLWLLYGSMRRGARNLYVMSLSDLREWQVTDLPVGQGAMWGHWRPIGGP